MGSQETLFSAPSHLWLCRIHLWLCRIHLPLLSHALSSWPRPLPRTPICVPLLDLVLWGLGGQVGCPGLPPCCVIPQCVLLTINIRSRLVPEASLQEWGTGSLSKDKQAVSRAMSWG